jgi:SOS-response transcriptional repressor LexA
MYLYFITREGYIITMAEERSTKRQKELLDFVDGFIQQYGYGPSYREIMNALGYKSVSTVAIHINGLIAKGYLRKRDNSARSLEVISTQYKAGVGPTTKAPSASQEKWLVEAINERFSRYAQKPDQMTMDELYVLIGTLKILGLEGAHEAMKARLGGLR